jgi:lipase chaperone LimK
MSEVRTFSKAPEGAAGGRLSADECAEQAATLANLARLFPDRAETFRAGERRWRQWALEARGAEQAETGAPA